MRNEKNDTLKIDHNFKVLLYSNSTFRCPQTFLQLTTYNIQLVWEQWKEQEKVSRHSLKEKESIKWIIDDSKRTWVRLNRFLVSYLFVCLRKLFLVPLREPPIKYGSKELHIALSDVGLSELFRIGVMTGTSRGAFTVTVKGWDIPCGVSQKGSRANSSKCRSLSLYPLPL